MDILIIEDNPDINAILTEKLHKEGFRAHNAFSGTEAKLLCEQRQYDLLLLDLMLPGLSGEEFITWFRKTNATPVIVISALEDVNQKIRLLEAGANDYLVKPFDLDELLARIHVQLRSETNLSKRFYHGDLCLDEAAYEIRWKEEHVPLTRQEYDILSLLLKYPNKVFTRRELLEKAWEDYYEGDDQTLSVHMSNIRKKLRNFTEEEIVETVWGVGFRIKKL